MRDEEQCTCGSGRAIAYSNIHVHLTLRGLVSVFPIQPARPRVVAAGGRSDIVLDVLLCREAARSTRRDAQPQASTHLKETTALAACLVSPTSQCLSAG